MSTWHQCTGEPPREKPYSERDLSQVEGDGGWVPLSVRTGTQSYAEWKAGDVSPPLPLVGTPAEPTAPEARCPDCGHACVEEGGSWWCSANAFACYNTGPMQGHEVWRRWGDTDKAVGVYWMPCGRHSAPGVVLVGSNGYCNPGQRGVYPMADDFWVLGPLSEPHVPGGE